MEYLFIYGVVIYIMECIYIYIFIYGVFIYVWSIYNGVYIMEYIYGVGSCMYIKYIVQESYQR